MKKIITIMCLLPGLALATPTVTMTPNSIAAKVPINFNSAANFKIEIPNSGEQETHYSYLASICPERQKCLTKEKKFTVAPHTVHTENFQLLTNDSYRQPGYIKNIAAIRLDGSESLNKQTIGYFDLR